MTTSPDKWSETDSRTFIGLADVAVAGREEALETLVSLVPAEPDEAFGVIDIGCGEGILLERLLERFAEARVTGFDGSELMRDRAKRRLAHFGERAEIVAFDLGDITWLTEIPSPVRAVLSSLALHHLDGPAKRSLFRELASRLEPGGALLVCDVVQPGNEVVRRTFAAQWDPIAREQSQRLTGSLKAYEEALAEGWNVHLEREPTPGETPSLLYEQLQWLAEAGLSAVDCFWMRAGLAVYGGYR
jgi:trans-aconitate methyltransferase